MPPPALGDERHGSCVTSAAVVQSTAPVPRQGNVSAKKGIGLVICGLLPALATAAVAVGAVKSSAPTSSARVALGPPVVRPGQQTTIAVSNVRADSLQVLLIGGTDK